jgi:hypothetical protein
MSFLSESNVSNKLASDHLSLYERHIPGPGHSYKAEGCAGRVEKRVAGVCSSGYFFKLPTCSFCFRVYLHAIDAPVSGIKEFEKVMNQVYDL